MKNVSIALAFSIYFSHSDILYTAYINVFSIIVSSGTMSFSKEKSIFSLKQLFFYLSHWSDKINEGLLTLISKK
ncbi:hypothetical protein XELAEV_18007890mg [Xenopus laevis]|uniref:Uncharacterized protein n=1 Tax=Xenopus laevis TaxID=8355 RepID=A0A974E2R2_XENLA|nr:hypothetical protein XELAEV_18007890mg [Xenopus laevis]